MVFKSIVCSFFNKPEHIQLNGSTNCYQILKIYFNINDLFAHS